MLFDSYPNFFRDKYLKVLNINTNKIFSVGTFFEANKYFGETRCDLHPRWSCDGGKLFVDSVHKGKRYLYQIDLDEECFLE